MDLLQACLYAAIDQEGFSGFWCPEFVGKKTVGLDNSLPTIALFDANAIESCKSCNFGKVLEAVKHASSDSCYDILLELKRRIDAYDEHLAAEEKKRRDLEAEKARRAKLGEHLVDQDYIS